MKLTLVISSMATGGAERVLGLLANSWADRGWEVSLVTTHDDGNPPFYYVDPRVTRIPILKSEISDNKLTGNLNRVFILREILRNDNPDFVVSFLNFTNILVLLACLGLNLKVVVSERLDPKVIKIGWVWSILRRMLYPRSIALVCQTESAANWFRGWMKEKVAVIPNPVLPPEEPFGEPEIDLKKPAIVAMGRLQPQKGFIDLIHAMSKVVATFPDWHLTVLGEGPLRPDLEKLRDELDLENNIHFPGRVKSINSVLKSAELFVLSSVTEGFPNALCEAMAVGLPVVSTSCPSGPEDIVRQGENGILVPVASPNLMAEAINGLLANHSLRIALGERAKEIVDQFSLARVLDQWGKILEKN